VISHPVFNHLLLFCQKMPQTGFIMSSITVDHFRAGFVPGAAISSGRTHEGGKLAGYSEAAVNRRPEGRLFNLNLIRENPRESAARKF
jgi:hypothetical protein